jgi:hypothetical protein
VGVDAMTGGRGREGDARGGRDGRRHPGRWATALAALLVPAAMMVPEPVRATGDLIGIDELLGSWQGDGEIQFIELRLLDVGQNQIVGNDIQIFGRTGGPVAAFRFANSVAGGAANARVLIATPKLAALAGLTADFVLPPGNLPSKHGRVCYVVNPPQPLGTRTGVIDCVAYGAYRGANPGFGRPTPITPDNRSLQRIDDTGDNRADFAGVLGPTPQNNAGDRTTLENDCGNGGIDDGEECDGTNLAGKTCASFEFSVGELRCTQCHFDTSRCTNCGDGDIDPDEQCDGDDLAGKTCADFGFSLGALACSDHCRFDTSACTNCGDGDVDRGEECDGEDLDGRTCARLGYTTGALACAGTCRFDRTDCAGPQIPGGGSPLSDCRLEWQVVNPDAPLKNDRPKARQRCGDGDGACDFDEGVADACRFRLQLCFNRDDLRLRPRCRPREVGTFQLRAPAPDAADPVDQANAGRLLAAVAALGGTPGGALVTFDPALATMDVCTEVAEVVVPLRLRAGKPPRRGRKVLKARVADAMGRRRDTDAIKLECLPAP